MLETISTIYQNRTKTTLFKFNDLHYIHSLCMSECSNILNFDLEKILSNSEYLAYTSFKIDKSKLSFLLGRYSAKQAFLLSSNDDTTDLKDIQIENGIFGQPILHSKYLDISIAHSDNIGIGLVFDKKYPMGVDVELIDSSQKNEIKNMTKYTEINSMSIENLISAWTMKEALSKILRCGLTIPFELLEIRQEQIKETCFRCTYANFPQYQGIAQIIGQHIVAVAFPIKTIVKFI